MGLEFSRLSQLLLLQSTTFLLPTESSQKFTELLTLYNKKYEAGRSNIIPSVLPLVLASWRLQRGISVAVVVVVVPPMLECRRVTVASVVGGRNGSGGGVVNNQSYVYAFYRKLDRSVLYPQSNFRMPHQPEAVVT
ncbi:hypothetical protein CBL_04615 [Carabus blaptoides fortunei]